MENKSFISLGLFLFFCFTLNSQSTFLEFQILNSDDIIKLEKIKSNNVWMKTQLYILKGNNKKYVGEIRANISEVFGVYYGMKNSKRLNYRLSIIYKCNSGLMFFSADRFLDEPNVKFPYKLKEGDWMETTVQQGGRFSELHFYEEQFQIDSIIWHNAKMFTINYKKPSREKLTQAEPKSFAEIDGFIIWLGPNRNEYSNDRHNLVEMNK